MSYILEALKKAQAERQLGNAPTLHAVPVGAAPADAAGARRRYPWLVGAGVALAVAAALLAWRMQSPEVRPAAPVVVAAAPVRAAPVPVAVTPAPMPVVAPPRCRRQRLPWRRRWPSCRRRRQSQSQSSPSPRRRR